MPNSPQPTTRTPPQAIRLFLHRAGFFWRGGAGVAGAVLAVFVCIAFVMSEIYESAAVLELSEQAGDVQDAAGRIRPALLARDRLTALVRAMHPDLGADETKVAEALGRARQSIDIRLPGARQLEIAFRAETALFAQRGADDLAHAALEQLVASARASAPTEGEDTARRALEDRTRALATFVAQHPEVALSRPSAPAEVSSAASSARAAPPLPTVD